MKRICNAAVTLKCGGDEAFWEAVQQVGWLLFTEEGVEIPNFEKRFGNSARRRLLTAKRVALYRAKKVGNADSVTKSLHDAHPVSVSDKAKEDSTKRVESPPKKTSAATAASAYGFPLQTGGMWYLPTKRLEEYHSMFADNIDVDRELKKIKLWLSDNKPKRSRGGSGTQGRITRWLTRAYDNAHKTLPGSRVAKVEEGDVYCPETGEIVKPFQEEKS